MLETFVGIIGSATIGLIAWIIQLGTRVSVLEAQRDAINERLERIEDKLDRVLSGRLIVTKE